MHLTASRLNTPACLVLLLPCTEALALTRALAPGPTIRFAAKLEEPRHDVPAAGVLCHLARTLPGVLAAVEVRVLGWCEWAPYRGYVHAPCM